MSEYNFEDGNVYSMANGKLVAKIDPETRRLVYEPGCAAAHGRKLTAWMEKNGIRPDDEAKPDEASDTEPENEAPEQEEKARLVVADIPLEMLPEWDPCLGTATRGFETFCMKSKLTEAQRIQLIRRLEDINRRKLR